MLAACGRLNPAMYGPSFRPPIPAEAIATRSKDAYPDRHPGRPADLAALRLRVRQTLGAEPVRRGVRRARLDGRLRPAQHHGRADPEPRAAQRPVRARPAPRDLAQRAAAEAGPDARGRVRRAYELALGRPPSDDELAAALEFLAAGRRPGCARRPLPRAVHAERVPLHRLNWRGAMTRMNGHIGPTAAADESTPGITNRRQFLSRAGAGFGMLALADLLGRDRLLAGRDDAAGPMAPKPPHHAGQGAFGHLAVHGGRARARWTPSTRSPS